MAEKYSADRIEVIHGIEAIRKRPGMYIGAVDTKGLHQMFDEILDNSVEEAFAGYCHKLK